MTNAFWQDETKGMSVLLLFRRSFAALSSLFRRICKYCENPIQLVLNGFIKISYSIYI